MDDLTSTHLEIPQVRIFVACPRSGSALLMRIFAESPDCAITSRSTPELSLKEILDPNYSISENSAHHAAFITARDSGKRFLICKEELRIDSPIKVYSLYNVFTNPSTEAMIRPVFLVRDPVRVFDSWKNVGWTNAESLIDCYTNMLRKLHQSSAKGVECLLYERLIQEPRTEIARICAMWEIPFSETMLCFNQPFGSSFFVSTDQERTIYSEKKSLGLFTTVEASSSIETDVPYHNQLSNSEKDHIEERLGCLYIRCWRDDVPKLRAILAKKTWIAFDLDDTLHEFRRSSDSATNAVLEQIAKRHGISMTELKDEYSRVLKKKTSNAFSDGRTSFDYRRERFASVLAHFSLSENEEFMAELLDSYETTLMASLELKCGAKGLLSTFKSMGKKIAIVTEGPQDAQERTIQGLGIAKFVDFIATTNHFRVTKSSGLFHRVLEHLHISPSEMAYVGDNEERDMKPAMAEGIFSIHLAETKHISLNTVPPQINTLKKLSYILLDGVYSGGREPHR